jgi:hypothetical protein
MQNDPVAFSQPGVVAVTQHFAAAAGDDLRHWFYFQMNRRVEQPKQQHTRIHTPLTLGTQGSFNSFFFLGSWNRLCAEGFQRLIVLVRFSSSPCRINLKISSFAQYGTYLHELNPDSMIWLESGNFGVCSDHDDSRRATGMIVGTPPSCFTLYRVFMTDVDKEAYWKTVPVRVDSSHRLVFDSLCRVILERKREGGGGG